MKSTVAGCWWLLRTLQTVHPVCFVTELIERPRSQQEKTDDSNDDGSCLTDVLQESLIQPDSSSDSEKQRNETGNQKLSHDDLPFTNARQRTWELLTRDGGTFRLCGRSRPEAPWDRLLPCR